MLPVKLQIEHNTITIFGKLSAFHLVKTKGGDFFHLTMKRQAGNGTFGLVREREAQPI
jgi:hypothetical protein